jgi:hypothetical protein
VLSDLECHEGICGHGRICLIHPVGYARMLEAILRVLIDAPDLRRRLGEEGARQARAFTSERFNTVFQLAVEDTVARFRGRRSSAARP